MFGETEMRNPVLFYSYTYILSVFFFRKKFSCCSFFVSAFLFSFPQKIESLWVPLRNILIEEIVNG